MISMVGPLARADRPFDEFPMFDDPKEVNLLFLGPLGNRFGVKWVCVLWGTLWGGSQGKPPAKLVFWRFPYFEKHPRGI